MGRPSLPLGTYGKIRLYGDAGSYRARTLYRDYDGVTRPVEKTGATKAAAERNLKAELRDRVRRSGGEEITADTRFAVVAEAWYREAVDAERSPTTLEAYRGCLDRHILKAFGGLRCREITTGIVDRHLRAIAANYGPGSAKTARSVVSGVCGLACRRDAMPANPVREVGTLPKAPKKPRTALTLVQARQFLALASYHDLSVQRDLIPLVMAMIGTGARVGEMCALCWDALDLDQGLIEIRGTTVRLKGRGTLVKPAPKSEAGERILRLPSWLVRMLQARAENPRPCITEIPLTTGDIWHSSPVFPSEHGFLRDRRNTAADIKELSP